MIEINFCALHKSAHPIIKRDIKADSDKIRDLVYMALEPAINYLSKEHGDRGINVNTNIQRSYFDYNGFTFKFLNLGLGNVNKEGFLRAIQMALYVSNLSQYYCLSSFSNRNEDLTAVCVWPDNAEFWPSTLPERNNEITECLQSIGYPLEQVPRNYLCEISAQAMDMPAYNRVGDAKNICQIGVLMFANSMKGEDPFTRVPFSQLSIVIDYKLRNCIQTFTRCAEYLHANKKDFQVLQQITEHNHSISWLKERTMAGSISQLPVTTLTKLAIESFNQGLYDDVVYLVEIISKNDENEKEIELLEQITINYIFGASQYFMENRPESITFLYKAAQLIHQLKSDQKDMHHLAMLDAIFIIYKDMEIGAQFVDLIQFNVDLTRELTGRRLIDPKDHIYRIKEISAILYKIGQYELCLEISIRLLENINYHFPQSSKLKQEISNHISLCRLNNSENIKKIILVQSLWRRRMTRNAFNLLRQGPQSQKNQIKFQCSVTQKALENLKKSALEAAAIERIRMATSRMANILHGASASMPYAMPRAPATLPNPTYHLRRTIETQLCKAIAMYCRSVMTDSIIIEYDLIEGNIAGFAITLSNLSVTDGSQFPLIVNQVQFFINKFNFNGDRLFILENVAVTKFDKEVINHSDAVQSAVRLFKHAPLSHTGDGNGILKTEMSFS